MVEIKNEDNDLEEIYITKTGKDNFDLEFDFGNNEYSFKLTESELIRIKNTIDKELSKK